MNITTLQSELESKDELVQALTKQLEQVAEQLDRVQRTGSRPSQAGGSLPPEFAKQHEAVAEDITYLVQQWDATQVGGSIGRVEIQLQEIRDLMTQLSSSSRPLSSSSNEPQFEQVSETVGEKATSSSDYLASLQTAFLDSEENTTTSDSDANDPSPAMPIDLNEKLPEQPEPVNFDLASTGDLKKAVLARDEYMKTVVDQLRRAKKQIGIQPPTDWEALQGCPDDLVQRVQELEQQLQDQLRLSAVSLSLERARLSREETQLNSARIQIQKELRKQGINPSTIQGLDPEAEAQAENEQEHEDLPVVEEKSSGIKWLSMLRGSGKS